MANFRPLAPVFISYRTSDGKILADTLSWALRATGVPVWHDKTDLPPGDTPRRLREALASGLSGAVLIVTPDMRGSEVVRTIELPELLRLEAHSGFTLAIGSVVSEDPATGHGLDYGAPDRLLDQAPGTLRNFKQYPMSDPNDIKELVRALAAQRMKAASYLGEDPLIMDIQTRRHSPGTPEVSLAVRTRPPVDGRSLPDDATWVDYAVLLADLPELLQIAGARHLHIRGGAHLSMAVALGSAIPIPAGHTVTVEDSSRVVWGDADDEPAEPVQLETQPVPIEGTSDARAPIAVYLDLIQDPPLEDGFGNYLARNTGRFSAAWRLSQRTRESIPANSANTLVIDLRNRIRTLAAEARTHRVHLFPALPFPIGVLLGRAFNTLEVTLYEWDRAAGAYVEAATVAPGTAGGPVLRSRPHQYPLLP